jgi:hypothetical protein
VVLGDRTVYFIDSEYCIENPHQILGSEKWSVSFMDREDRYSHIRTNRPNPERMSDFQIFDLYNSLSVHFNVPVPEWKILPNIYASFDGMFLKEPQPVILFFLRPTLTTAMHEFMHYLVYCVKTGVEINDKEEFNEAQIQKLKELLAEKRKRGIRKYIQRVSRF